MKFAEAPFSIQETRFTQLPFVSGAIIQENLATIKFIDEKLPPSLTIEMIRDKVLSLSGKCKVNIGNHFVVIDNTEKLVEEFALFLERNL